MTTFEIGYAGDVTASEAYALLLSRADAVLVDVRSQPEWSFVGVPDLSAANRDVLLIQWQLYPTMASNEDFVSTLMGELRRRGTPRDAPLLFLCRSGARSQAAAQKMSEQGFTNCLNVAGGFEGPLDAARHRGSRDGWKAQALPWRQS
jgi:rhodanese-related sulfurtransferase